MIQGTIPTMRREGDLCVRRDAGVDSYPDWTGTAHVATLPSKKHRTIRGEPQVKWNQTNGVEKSPLVCNLAAISASQGRARG